MQRVTCVGLGHADSDGGDDGGIDVDNSDGDGDNGEAGDAAITLVRRS